MAVTYPRSQRLRRRSRAKPRPRSYRRRQRDLTRITIGRNALVRRIPRNRGLSPFPRSRITRHRYVDTVTMATNGVPGVPQYYIYRANSTYDPDLTGTGHQPMFRDEMANIYTNYTVLNAYIKVTFYQGDTAQMHYAVIASNDAALTNDPLVLKEQYRLPVARTASLNSKPVVRKASYDAKKWWKTSMSGIMADDTFKTPVASNASRAVHFHVAILPMNPAATGASTVCQVELVQIVMWRDNENPVSS